MLRRFGTQQTNTVEDIRAALESGDLAAAERHAHQLKGVAANLGVTSLAELAGATETLLRAGQPVPAETLNQLAATSARVATAIRAALPHNDTLSDVNAAISDAGETSAVLGRLVELLERSDGVAGDYLQANRRQIAGVMSADALSQLIEHIGEYEYDAALDVVRLVTEQPPAAHERDR